MAITLSYIPPIALSGDPLPITFTTDNFKLSDGVKASGFILFTSNPALNDDFSITFNSTTITFTVVASPDDSGTQIREKSGSESLGDWVQNACLPVINSNKTIVDTFRFFEGGNTETIDFESWEPEAIPDLAFVFNIAAAESINSTGADPAYRENFKINYQLFYADTNNSISGVESLEPDTDATVTIDIAELIQGLAANTFIFDSENVSDLLPDDVVAYQIRTWESYGLGDDYTEREVIINNTNRVIEGATSWMEQAQANENNSFWFNTLTLNPWLTRKPIESNILPDQIILLKFLQFEPGSATTGYANTVNIKTYDANNKVSLIQHNLGITNVYDIFQVDVSPERLELSDDIIRYEVYLQISYQNLIKSEIYTFNIDRTYRNNIRYFLFRNSFGGFDTIQGLGIGTASEKYNRARALTALPNNFTTNDRETRVVSVDHQVNFKANLGFSNNWGTGVEKWANYIRQLFASIEAYEIIQGVYYPIDIISQTAPLLEDENYIPGFFDIEYTRAYIERGATSDIPALQGSYTDQYTESYD